MNCKEGDLAIVVKSVCGNEGKVVRCLELHPAGFDRFAPFLGPIWVTDNNSLAGVWIRSGLPAESGNAIPDAYLRPIRDNPGEDETLTWAPRKEPVAA